MTNTIVIILCSVIAVLLVTVIFLALSLGKKKRQREKQYEMDEPEIKFNDPQPEEESYMNTFFIYDQEEEVRPSTQAIPNLSKEEKTEILFQNQQVVDTPINNTTRHGVIKYNQGNGDVFFNMKDSAVIIGRDPEYCDIVLNFDKYAGRTHAAIIHKNNKLYLIDLNSKNGSYVDGARIQGLVEVNERSRIKIASTDIEVQL